jgi:hypothetical protein
VTSFHALTRAPGLDFQIDDLLARIARENLGFHVRSGEGARERVATVLDKDKRAML